MARGIGATPARRTVRSCARTPPRPFARTCPTGRRQVLPSPAFPLLRRAPVPASSASVSFSHLWRSASSDRPRAHGTSSSRSCSIVRLPLMSPSISTSNFARGSRSGCRSRESCVRAARNSGPWAPRGPSACAATRRTAGTAPRRRCGVIDARAARGGDGDRLQRAAGGRTGPRRSGGRSAPGPGRRPARRSGAVGLKLAGGGQRRCARAPACGSAGVRQATTCVGVGGAGCHWRNG
jgi:hypothetical protein